MITVSRHLALGLTGSVVVALLLSAGTAHAQIYSWRDANGQLVVSDIPPTPDVPTVRVAGTESVRATRRVVVADAPGRFEALIDHHASRTGLRPELVRAVIQVESGFDPEARSPVGAMGLMQLMPDTAAELGVVDPFDPDDNLWGGTRYLRQLLDRYAGNEELALAAYNAGPGAVARYGNRVPPFPETQRYLHRVRSTTGLSGQNTVPGATGIYKGWQLVEGKRIPVYTNTPSATGDYQPLAPNP